MGRNHATELKPHLEIEAASASASRASVRHLEDQVQVEFAIFTIASDDGNQGSLAQNELELEKWPTKLDRENMVLQQSLQGNDVGPPASTAVPRAVIAALSATTCVIWPRMQAFPSGVS